MTMAPLKKRVEKEGGKTSLSSNEIRQEAKASVIGYISDSVSDNESRPAQ
jgi:hypothetical protein